MPNTLPSLALGPTQLALGPEERAQLYQKWAAEQEGVECYDFALLSELKFKGAGFRSARPSSNAANDATDPNQEHEQHAYSTFNFTIPRAFCNIYGVLHGGAVATIFDVCTSTALHVAAKKGFWDIGHVSRTLNCAFLRPIMAGEEVEIDCEVVHLGRRMGMVNGTMRRKSDRKLCYTCEHQKATLEAKM